MKQNILLVNDVHDYNAFVGQRDLHPLVSVIDFSKLEHFRRCYCHFGVYALFLYESSMQDLVYGRQPYDYRAGTLICCAPGQVGGAQYDGKPFDIKGWALLFHPDLLHGTSLGSQMNDYTYFSYQVNETLYMNEEEQGIFISLLMQMKDELEQAPDIHQDSIIVSYMELVLKHTLYFYARQFATRKPMNDDVLARFERLLQEYYTSGRLASEGMPSVAWCAQELCFSPNYFSDLVRNATGETAAGHIRRMVIDMVKARLAGGYTLKEISAEVGFNHPQHLSRLFKNHTGETPQSFMNRIKRKI